MKLFVRMFFTENVDEVFRNRWRTLLSVDDAVDNIMKVFETKGMLDETIAMFTSDHGYHLGTYGLPLDKRMPYETDIRVPLLVRGPNVPNMVQPATSVITLDLAPTILDIAGLDRYTDFKLRLHQSKCENFIIFQSFRFYVKPKL